MTKPQIDEAPNGAPPQVLVHRIYVKNSLFEAAMLTPEILKSAQQGNIDFEAKGSFNERDDQQYEAVLTLNFTAKFEGSLLWRVQMQQAGLYTIKNFSEEQRNQIINGFCMNQLYPYACAMISQLVVQGGFPAPQLLPIDFSQAYQEQTQANHSGTVQ